VPPQRASSGHKNLAAAVASNVKERAALFAASPHEWCAAQRHRLLSDVPSLHGAQRRAGGAPRPRARAAALRA
jgi:hypothetical protein